MPEPSCPVPGRARAAGISPSDQVEISDRADALLTQADQARDWKRRWSEIKREHRELMEPLPGPITAEVIHAARQRLHAFYIQAYHLKDSLGVDAAATGISRGEVEAAINREPTLTLLADLANMDKHAALDRHRSGEVPVIGPASGSTAGLDVPGWRLELEITHKSKRLDGLTVAGEAVESSQRVLADWGLLGP